MFCKKCGKESVGSQKFCTSCGNAFVINSQTQLSKKEPVKRPPMPKEKWTVGRIIKAVIISVILFVVIVLKFGLGTINSTNNSAINTNNNALKSYESGNNDQAITQFQQASRDAVTNDTKVNTLKNLAYVYSSDEKNELALSTFQEALVLTSTNSFDYYLISGEIAVLENKPNSAYLSYTKAYQMNPDDFQINNALALFDMDLKSQHPEFEDYKSALTYAQKAYSVSKLELAKQNLGMAYYFNENYDQAISTFGSISLDKDTLTAYWLGLSYARNDDAVNAKIYLQRAIDNGVKVPQTVYDYLNSH